MSDKEMLIPNKQEATQNGEPTRPEKQFVPAVDIYETQMAVTVLAEMPGVDKDSVSVNIEDGAMTIRGQAQEAIPAGETALAQEYESGQYFRSFTLSETIAPEQIQASMADGILTLVMPKAAPISPQKIEVKEG